MGGGGGGGMGYGEKQNFNYLIIGGASDCNANYRGAIAPSVPTEFLQKYVFCTINWKLRLKRGAAAPTAPP